MYKLIQFMEMPKEPSGIRKFSDYPISEDLRQLGRTLVEPSPEKLANDPKLAYLLVK